MGIGLALTLAGCAPPLYRQVTLAPVATPGASALAPAEARAAYVKARLALLRGDLAAARAYAVEARRFDPDDPAVLALLAEVGG